jgi:hypothetical protein
LVLGGVSFTPEVASANGAFPSARQLKSEPGDPDHLVLVTTFGLLVTRDHGASWDWLCEAGALYRDVEPLMAVLPGGRILLAVPDGIARSDAAGCQFELASELDGLVTDLARIVTEPEGVIAVSTFGTSAQVWLSADAGATFTPLGSRVENLIVQTLDIAPSDASVIYLSGTSGTEGALFRSADQGESYERFVVPHTSTAHVPYIAAIDPRDADTVYVRLTGTPSELLVTRDGGHSFSSVLRTVTPVAGFALSPDGETLVVSNSFDGTFRASTKRLEFEKIACSGPTCLLFEEDALFGCGENGADGYVVGRSSNLGATFERVIDLSCVRGPLACDSETSVGRVCPAAWPAIQAQIGATACEPTDVAPYTECFAGAGGEDGVSGSSGGSGDGARGGTAGAGRGGTASGGSAGTTATGGGAGAPIAGAGGDEPSGCDCRVAHSGRVGRGERANLALSCGGWLLWLARRRRRAGAQR